MYLYCVWDEREGTRFVCLASSESARTRNLGAPINIMYNHNNTLMLDLPNDILMGNATLGHTIYL